MPRYDLLYDVRQEKLAFTVFEANVKGIRPATRDPDRQRRAHCVDDETCRLEPIENLFGPKVLPMCSE